MLGNRVSPKFKEKLYNQITDNYLQRMITCFEWRGGEYEKAEIFNYLGLEHRAIIIAGDINKVMKCVCGYLCGNFIIFNFLGTEFTQQYIDFLNFINSGIEINLTYGKDDQYSYKYEQIIPKMVVFVNKAAGLNFDGWSVHYVNNKSIAKRQSPIT